MVPLRVVLDTNVWVDWLVFDDPTIAAIKTAAVSGAAQIFIDDHCAHELETVLARELTKKPLPATDREAWRRLVHYSGKLQGAATSCGSDEQSAAALPTCRDPDDQKFLELADDCRADLLITRDRELLILGRRKSKPLPFRVVTPTEAAAALTTIISAQMGS
jgi:uncharacterized protein